MKKIVVCMPLDEQLQKKIFASLKKLVWLENCEIDFVHIFKQESFPYMLPPTVFPDQGQAIEIKKTLIDIFQGLTKELNFSQKHFNVAFDESPKAGMVSYLKKNHADMVITFVKEKHGIAGFFSSSFTEHLVAHSPCSVLALR